MPSGAINETFLSPPYTAATCNRAGGRRSCVVQRRSMAGAVASRLWAFRVTGELSLLVHAYIGRFTTLRLRRWCWV